MYNYKNILCIISAISSCEKAMRYAENFTTSTALIEADEQLYFNATITLLIAIAEEVKKLDKALLETEPGIEWQNIADMRNVLAHDYRGVDEDIVFDVVKKELPKLSEALVHFLKAFPNNEIEEVLKTKQYKDLQKIIFA